VIAFVLLLWVGIMFAVAVWAEVKEELTFRRARRVRKAYETFNEKVL